MVQKVMKHHKKARPTVESKLHTRRDDKDEERSCIRDRIGREDRVAQHLTGYDTTNRTKRSLNKEIIHIM